VLAVLLAVSLRYNLRQAREGWRFLFASKARSLETPEDQEPNFTEIWSWGDGEIKAVRVTIDGVIERSVSEGLLGVPRDPTESLLRQIRAAQQDADVRLLLVEVDSPGGELSPTDEIHRALCAFRESRQDRKVVVWVKGLAASGGYYIAAAADRIVAQPTALIGSISVLLQTLNWHVLSQRIGVTDVTIRSGRNKDLLNPFQPVAEEQLAILQRIVDEAHARFVELVAAGRGLSIESVTPMADGRIFTAAEAFRLGLVDAVGYWEDALAEAEKLAGGTLRLVRYERPGGWLARLLSARQPLRIALPSPPAGARLMCIWQP